MQVHVNPTFFQSFGGINFIEEDIRKINFDPLGNRNTWQPQPFSAIQLWRFIEKHFLQQTYWWRCATKGFA